MYTICIRSLCHPVMYTTSTCGHTSSYDVVVMGSLCHHVMYTICGHYVILLYALHMVTMSFCDVHFMWSQVHPVVHTTCGQYVTLWYTHYMSSCNVYMIMSYSEICYCGNYFLVWYALYVVTVIVWCTLHEVIMSSCGVHYTSSLCHAIIYTAYVQFVFP